MKLLDIVHPAAKTLVDIAKSQDAEVCSVLIKFHTHTLICDILPNNCYNSTSRYRLTEKDTLISHV